MNAKRVKIRKKIEAEDEEEKKEKKEKRRRRRRRRRAGGGRKITKKNVVCVCFRGRGWKELRYRRQATEEEK
jgi:hypothetical protein